jgi:broad specificity phosphatase PhoE
MPPVIYYVRHGLTDWNAASRLQGGHDVPLNDRGRGEARHCADILRGLFAKAGREPPDLDYVSSPLIRARETMEIIRVPLGLSRDGYRVDARLSEISFGEWEGLTYADVLERDKDVVARREGNKWGFLPPGGESYAQLSVRIKAWYGTVERDTVVTAHGGTARALIAVLGIAPPEEATHRSVGQGVVYVFAGGRVTRYA